jgi:hypothetical protein
MSPAGKGPDTIKQPMGTMASHSAGYRYFGHVKIDAKTGRLTLTIRDVLNRILYSQLLSPDR